MSQGAAKSEAPKFTPGARRVIPHLKARADYVDTWYVLGEVLVAQTFHNKADAHLCAAAVEMYCELEIAKGTLQDLLDANEVHEDAVPGVKRAMHRIEAVQRLARGEPS